MDAGCELVSSVDRLSVVMAELAACSVAHLVEPDASRVHAALRAAQDAIGLVAAKVLGRIEADGRWATTTGRGARDLDGWLAQESGGSRAGARRQTRLARAVSDETIPGLADAVTGGRVSLEHADVLTRLAPTSSLRKAALVGPDSTGNAAYLLGKAATMGVGEFTTLVKRWAARIDPTADERGHRDATTKVTCALTPRDDDTVAMSAVMTTVDGAAFDAALTAVAGIPSIEDSRTHAQRMGAALGDMARLILDHGLAAGRSGGFRPHLTVTVSLDSLAAQVTAIETRAGEHAWPELPSGWEPAVLADGSPIPASVLARLACDSEVSRVVFGPASQVLDVGRTQRLYTGSLRRAVVARDRHCSYPGCDRAPARCEVHHVRSWAAGGETSLANGILLCWWHHEVVHTRHQRIHRDHTRGRWDFHGADGTPIPHPGGRATGERRIAGPDPGEREIARPDPTDRDDVGINEPALFEVAS